MNPQLTPNLLTEAQQRQLTAKGWLVLPRVASSAKLAAMHQGWEVAEARSDISGNNWGPRDLQREPAFAWCLNEAHILAALRVLLHREPVLRSFHGRAPPHGLGQQGLHADWSAPVRPDEQLLANVFWALDDMSAQNGATRIVPESHRWQRSPKGLMAQPAGAHPEELVIEARAGDALVFSAHLWHSGTRNTSGARRRLAIAQFQY